MAKHTQQLGESIVIGIKQRNAVVAFEGNDSIDNGCTTPIVGQLGNALQTVKRKIHWRLLVASFLFILPLFSSQLVWAQAALKNPQPGSFEAAYGTSRDDTAGPCSDDGLNGFGLLFNWSLLGDGTHQIRALADGQEFATVSFVVATFGEEFLNDSKSKKSGKTG